MSTSNYVTGQKVLITESHNQFEADNTKVYSVAQVNRISGQHMVMLSYKDKVVGALPENKVKSL